MLLTFGSSKMLRRDKRHLVLANFNPCAGLLHIGMVKSGEAYLRPPPVAPRRSTRRQRLKTRNGLILKLIFSKGKVILN
jgi:hypothetical protein